MPDRRAARHRAPRSRRRSVGVIGAVLLVPATAVAAVFVVRSQGGPPTGLANAGHPRAGSARAGTAGSPAAEAAGTAGTPGGHLSAGSGRAGGRDRRTSRPGATPSPNPGLSVSPGGNPSPQEG